MELRTSVIDILAFSKLNMKGLRYPFCTMSAIGTIPYMLTQ